jgi:glycosyltransferase involved in cell wall biosynthesis
MKIVYCLPDTYRPGGIERVVSLKASYLADIIGHEIVIITSGQASLPSYYAFSKKIKFIDLNINHDKTLDYPLIKRFYIRRKLRKIHKIKLTNILFKLRADLVISTFTHEASFLPYIKDGSKKILEFHFSKGYKNELAKVSDFSIFTKLGYFYKTYLDEKIIIPKYDAFVVLTNEDKKNWGNINKKTIKISNPLTFAAIESSNCINHNVIAVGRLDLQKGFDKLIKIWSRVSKIFPDWKLSIYGGGKEKANLTRMINEYGLGKQVKIFPPERAIEKHYINSSIYLMTSRFEGYGMTLQESMSFGVPSISYDCKSGPSEIITNKVDGFLIKMDNEDDFFNKLSMLLSNQSLRIEMGNNANINMKRFSLKFIMEEWSELFTDLSKDNKR